MEWMVMPLRRYADFAGRSRRKEFWLFTLFMIVLYILVGFVEAQLGLGQSISDTSANSASYYYNGGPLIFVLWLVLLVPGLAVTVRRMHDQDKSGWLVLLGLIPLVGGIVILVFMCLEGTRGSNRFGPDPKGPDESTSDVFS